MMGSATFLLFSLLWSAQLVACADRYLVTAPNVFHVGVKERVSVQLGPMLFNSPVTLYLEVEASGKLMSERVQVVFNDGEEGKTKIAMLEVSNEASLLKGVDGDPPYLMLVCEIRGERKQTRVLVSKHKGYIFIQTNQPIYNPDQKVSYKIFTLDHAMKPVDENIHVSVTNAGGNRIKSETIHTKNGIFSKNFNIPDISEPGVWKITAHFKGDEKNPTTREFKVQKFVLPSFVASITPERNFFLANSESFTFSIEAKYSYGESVDGGFHSRFGLIFRREEGGNEVGEDKKKEITFIRGMEKTGAIKDGKAQVVIPNVEEFIKTLNTSAQQLAEEGAKLYVAVSVTDIKSGELQEAEALLPIVLHPYLVDLSRVQPHFLPGLPFEPAVVVRLPNGSPAPGVQMQIEVTESQEKKCDKKSNNDGVAYCSFNLPTEQNPTEAKSISVKVTVEGTAHEKTVTKASSPSNSFLYLSTISDVVKMTDTVKIQFKAVNTIPADGFFYYMIHSKGELRKVGSEKASEFTQTQISFSPDMVPSFRLVAYFYLSNGEIISNSIWVDVEDACKGTFSLSQGKKEKTGPGQSTKVNIDLGNQKATVSLLAVDKAIYGLTSPNKLTSKQVFSSMQSYDLGCSYGGGSDSTAVLNQAGLSFISSDTSLTSQMRIGFSCESGFRRQKRSPDLQTKMSEREQRYKDQRLKKCCHSGLVLIPMLITCEERAERVQLRHKQDCVDAFLDCCREGKLLREQKKLEDMRKGFGRTSGAQDIEDFFDSEEQMIRQYFPPSFSFVDIAVDGKKEHTLLMPDSITTWEIQAVSLSQTHGICVAEPLDIEVCTKVFLSLRLPYSVKRFEQLSIPVVVYNYGEEARELAVHMKQVDGLCSPAAKTSNSYQEIHVGAHSSLTVSFPAVPMALGSIPIIIQLYDREREMGVDAIQKMLSVKTEGFLKKIHLPPFYVNLDGKSDKIYNIPGEFPNSTVPDSDSTIAVKIEGEVFGKAAAVPMLSPSKVKHLISAPMGCAEQTMMLMSPTALSLRYLDHGNHWVQLPAGKRDEAIDFIEKGYERIMTYKKGDGSYGAWLHRDSSTWLTALVVKVLSLVAERQAAVTGVQGRAEKVVQEEDIRQSVQYLLNLQHSDGHFFDPKPVIHREMQGGIGGVEAEVSLTAFITLAVNHSLPFLNDAEKKEAEDSISKSTTYLLNRVSDLKTPFAMAITTYCLSTCLSDLTMSEVAWENLKTKATQEGECKVWRADFSLDGKGGNYMTAEALTVETTAYALLAAVAQKNIEWADDAACYLATRENYRGGWASTQDTIVALEALSVYAMNRPESPFSKMSVNFHVPGKSQTESLAMDDSGLAVETDLKRLVGHSIIATVKGVGKAKMKVEKLFYILEPKTSCDDVSIKVTVTGKMDYTEKILQDYNYDYEDDEHQPREKRDVEDIPLTEIEWFDARSRRKRDTKQSADSQENVKYNVCVSHNLDRNLTGMAIADITLLSGFDVEVADLDKLKEGLDQYISHYEVSANRVLLYFNEILNGSLCVSFGARQTVPIGLIQPASATFYDYYAPDRKCDIFYSAPKRSKMISKLCSEDVCECAERPCFEEKKFSSEKEIRKSHRVSHACYGQVVEYGYKVKITSVTPISNFMLYSGTVTDIFRATGDMSVTKGDTRVFAKRMQCRGSLDVGKTYLIMGHDGTTKDTFGQMQYLLDSRTWVEQEPDGCQASLKRKYCKEYKEFIKEYEVDGCNQ